MLLPSADLRVALSGLQVDAEACRRVDQVVNLEWLDAGARGVSAFHTVALCPTRRAHGLLRTPDHVLLSRYEEVLHVGGEENALSTARYPGTWAPQGWRHLRGFRLAPHPVFSLAGEGWRVQREILVARSAPAVLCRYRLEGSEPAELRLRPLLACRAHEDIARESEAIDARVDRVPDGVRVRPHASQPALVFTAPGLRSFEAEPYWYRDVELRADWADGADAREAHWSPGELRVRLDPGRPVVVAAALDAPIADPTELWGREERAAAARLLTAGDGPESVLRATADVWLAPGGLPEGATRWRALPGLLLSRDRLAESASRLAAEVEEPTTAAPLPDDLWFARAVLLHQRASGDEPFAQLFVPRLDGIAARAVAEAENLHGAPLALAYSVVAHLEELALARDDAQAHRRLERARRILRRDFLERFDPEGIDAETLVAASLEHSPLSRPGRAAVLDVVERQRLTARGVRVDDDRVEPAWIGSFVEAWLRAHGPRRASVQHVLELLGAFQSHLHEQALGFVTEAFAAEAPHRPLGAVADPMAHAELLRAWRMARARRP